MTSFDDAISKVEMALFNAHIYLLPAVLNNLQKAMRSEKDELALNKLSSIGANVARTLDQTQVAEMLIETVLNKPASGAMDLFQTAKRLRVRLYLDAGDLHAARSLADSVDALEIESSAFLKKDVTMVVVSKNNDNLSVETWILLTEVACACSEPENAAEMLAFARKRLFEDEQQVSNQSMTLKERTAAQKRIADCRLEIEFWQIVIYLLQNDAGAAELLGGFKSSIETNPKADKRLLARIKAVAGEWQLYETAPVGISLAEAQRLYEMRLPANLRRTSLQLIEDSQLPAVVTKEFALVPESPDTDAVTKLLIAQQTETSSQISALTQVCRQLIEKSLASAPTVSVEAGKSRSLAGGLDKIILPALLELALESSLTGYFEMSWEADDLDSSIKAKRISPRSAAGRGYIFIQNRVITDATLVDYDPADDKLNDTSDAEDALLIMLQISMGIGLDAMPTGYIFFRHAPTVATRQPRLELNKNSIVDCVVKLDEKMEFPAEETALELPVSVIDSPDDVLELPEAEEDEVAAETPGVIAMIV